MAVFSNQATLTYNGTTTNSNVAYGEILEVLTATKTAVEGGYTPGEPVTYVVTLRNTSAAPLTGLTLSDDLGSYDRDGATVFPLTYETGSIRLFVNGVPQPVPAPETGGPLVVTGLTVPAGGDLVLVYQARANGFADPNTGSTLTNTVTVTGAGLAAPVVATAVVNAAQTPAVTITKTITPARVTDNGRVTYSFVIQNSGNRPVGVGDNAAIRDVFNPVLSDLVVTYEGQVWAEEVQYTYDPVTGLFATVPGQITVPAATFTRDPDTGAFLPEPGVVTLTVTGTI